MAHLLASSFLSSDLLRPLENESGSGLPSTSPPHPTPNTPEKHINWQALGED